MSEKLTLEEYYSLIETAKKLRDQTYNENQKFIDFLFSKVEKLVNPETNDSEPIIELTLEELEKSYEM